MTKRRHEYILGYFRNICKGILVILGFRIGRYLEQGGCAGGCATRLGRYDTGQTGWFA